MTKKNILVVFTGPMELGGIERSLIGLLSSFDYEKYNVDLFLYGHHGPLFTAIDPHVNLLPECKELSYLRDSFRNKLSHGCYYSAALRLRDGIISLFRETDIDRTWATVMRHCTKKIDKHYDLALSFFLPFDFLYERVDASVKVGWVHTDYSVEKVNKANLYEQYKHMDYISAVSDACRKTFCSVFPELKGKTLTIENILPAVLIKEQADEKVDDFHHDSGSVALLSVGRFTFAKNFDNVPDICARILKKKINVVWYLIGFGGDEELIRDKIAESHMKDHVILLGKKVNPYPYIKMCDWYVQPSRYEGKAVTVCEAQLLHKPVIITDYPTSKSQVNNGVDGIIVPLDNEKCAEGIAKAIRDESLKQRLIANTYKKDYSNKNEINKLYSLM